MSKLIVIHYPHRHPNLARSLNPKIPQSWEEFLSTTTTTTITCYNIYTCKKISQVTATILISEISHFLIPKLFGGIFISNTSEPSLFNSLLHSTARLGHRNSTKKLLKGWKAGLAASLDIPKPQLDCYWPVGWAWSSGSIGTSTPLKTDA